jgi:hypothetical protein
MARPIDHALLTSKRRPCGQQSRMQWRYAGLTTRLYWRLQWISIAGGRRGHCDPLKAAGCTATISPNVQTMKFDPIDECTRHHGCPPRPYQIRALERSNPENGVRHVLPGCAHRAARRWHRSGMHARYFNVLFATRLELNAARGATSCKFQVTRWRRTETIFALT